MFQHTVFVSLCFLCRRYHRLVSRLQYVYILVLFLPCIRSLTNSCLIYAIFPFPGRSVGRERSGAEMPRAPRSAGECHGSPGPCSELVVYGSGIRPLLTRKYTPPPHDRRNHHGIPACGIVNCTRRITYCALFTVERSETITKTFGWFTQGSSRPLSSTVQGDRTCYAGGEYSCFAFQKNVAILIPLALMFFTVGGEKLTFAYNTEKVFKTLVGEIIFKDYVITN